MISKKLVAAVGAGAVAGALGVSVAGGAFTASASPATTTAVKTAATTTAAGTAATKARPHHAGRFAGLGGGFLHGEGVVKTKTGYQTVDVARGTVTKVTGSTVTVTSADKVAQTFTVVPGSKIRLDGKTVALSAAKVGDKAGALAVKKGTGEYDVKTLVLRDAAAKKPSIGSTSAPTA